MRKILKKIKNNFKFNNDKTEFSWKCLKRNCIEFQKELEEIFNRDPMILTKEEYKKLKNKQWVCESCFFNEKNVSEINKKTRALLSIILIAHDWIK